MIRKNEEILKDIEYLVENDLIDIMNESSLFNINDNSLYTLYGELSSIFVISRIYNYILLKFRFNMVNVNTDNYDYVFGIFSRFILLKLKEKKDSKINYYPLYKIINEISFLQY